MAERSVAPYLRADVHTLGADHAATERRVAAIEVQLAEMAAVVAGLAEHQPAVLNAISSSNG
ncbi:MAG TPA: hypothetical protein PLV68_13040, partial [Ilumatobacteraceae bacterium]|nr:hypothetical protein [Ilumatobacteraceae bacterium]